MDEKIKKTLDKVIALAKQNPEFGNALRENLGIRQDSFADISSYGEDIRFIRKVLGIQANPSIDYSFLKSNPRLQKTLIIDNLRMENVILDTEIEEEYRFQNFCINAFYQVENLINYYCHTRFPNISDLLSYLEKYTEKEESNYQFHRSGNEKNVASIRVYAKLQAVCNELYSGDKNISKKSFFNGLRIIRNEAEHRSHVIEHEIIKNETKAKFIQVNTFISVRQNLQELATTISNKIYNVQNAVRQNADSENQIEDNAQSPIMISSDEFVKRNKYKGTPKSIKDFKKKK